MLRVYPETPQLEACPKLDGFHKLSTLTLRGHMTQPQEQGKKYKKSKALRRLISSSAPAAAAAARTEESLGCFWGLGVCHYSIWGFRV